MQTLVRLLATTAMLTACADREEPYDPPSQDGTLVYLTPTQHLTRASLALRGQRPSIEDLETIASDPTKLPGIVDRYLQDPAFGRTIRDLHNASLLLRVEQGTFTYPALGTLEGITGAQMNGSLLEEPLRLIEDLVMNDRPYSEVVTADYTMADGIVATVWGLPHTGPTDRWERTAWTDGRGPAGVLASSVLYHRWRSAGANYQRGRANLISRAFLCHDFIHGDINIDTSIDLSDPDVVANAVVENKSCAGCHQTLDPLASFLFPFKNQINSNQVDAYPVAYYDAGRIDLWRRTNKRPPLFFGQEAAGLAGLGQAIAADPRFSRCAASRFASFFTEVPENQLSGAWVARLQQTFLDTAMNAKQLAKAVVLSDEFRVSHDTDPASAEGVVGALKLSPEQMSRVYADLTGFTWNATSTAQIRNGMPIGTSNLLESDFIGFRVLGGGIDSYFVTEPVHTSNATSSLVERMAAAQAASFVVDHDAAAPAGARTLFVAADVTTIDEPAVRAQLAHLHARLYGELVSPDAAEVTESYTLFRDALAVPGVVPRRAWKLTLTAMLSDVRSLYY
ncbi:MAG: hypothetical protein WKG01_36975 [Kofleriaceae bacterium]